MGKLVLDQGTRVVRGELATIGAQEVSFPALLPREPYERSGRWDEYGEDVFRLTDRRGTGYPLAPTHEELFAILVRDLCGSDRGYPLLLFPGPTKYPDETPPPGGLAPRAEGPMQDSASTVLDTPDTPTIDTLVARLNAIRAGGRDDWRAADTLKNVALTVDGELVVIGVPGDRGVDLKRVEAVLFPARVAMFEDFASRPDLVRGYLGPQGSWKARYLGDPRVVTGTAWAPGANEPGRHAIDVVCGRDFVPDGTIEAATVRADDPCPRCGTGPELRRGVEIGQIFQLGRRFADVFGLDASGPDGTPIRITMGSYGIGLSRAVATIVEQHHDERGLVWPAEVAPAHVHVVPLRDPAPALDLGARLSGAGAGLRVLVDDRPGLSAGVRFADAELLGMPYTVVLGRRFADGYVELRNRATGEHRDVPVEELTTWLG